MELRREHFSTFFAAVNSGHEPFHWQERLVTHLYTSGCWPAAIVAPTGTGKSAVVEIHVFMTALYAAGAGPRLPRRLAAVVGRRGLVDAQADRVLRIQRYLSEAENELASTLRSLLLSLRTNIPADEPLVLGHLRGGLVPDQKWIDDPAACAVICATPDMWGSRLLMRGYGTSLKARPREAGILAVDSVVVVDEAHMARQLTETAHQIALMEAEHAEKIGVPGLQVVQTTATFPKAMPSGAVGIEPRDLTGSDANPLLVARLNHPKPISYAEAGHWVLRGKELVNTLADQATMLATEISGGTVLCVVNQVDTAVQLAKRLGPDTPCWVGRMRPIDLAKLRTDHAHLLGLSDEPDRTIPRFLVATQTIEVGVDADFAAMVTELAPGDALAQRSGRVNRRGNLPCAPIVVVGPDKATLTGKIDSKLVKAARPYKPADLYAAHQWLLKLDQCCGLSPDAISRCAPPAATPERTLPKIPQLFDAQRWVATSDPSAVDEDLALWLRDSLEPDELLAGIVLRTDLPEEDSSALALLAATPPTDREVFPSTIGLVRQHLERILRSTQRNRAFLFRDGEVFIWTAQEADEQSRSDHLQPGDIIMLDSCHRVSDKGVIVEPNQVNPAVPEAVWGDEGVIVVLPGSADADWLTELVGLNPEEAQQRFESAGRSEQITLPPGDPELGRLAWLVLRPQQSTAADESLIQEWTTNSDPVLLTEHQEAVGDRARKLAMSLGLTTDYAIALELAGIHHDDGKRDRRFQRQRLGNNGREYWAKSLFASGQAARRARWQGLLPHGYRHELASVVRAWEELSGTPSGQLALRLIGTSHGYARGVPPNSSMELFGPDDSDLREQAARIFDDGEWNSLLDQTEWLIGPWVCCYLEALLRAADCQVSREGS